MRQGQWEPPACTPPLTKKQHLPCGRAGGRAGGGQAASLAGRAWQCRTTWGYCQHGRRVPPMGNEPRQKTWRGTPSFPRLFMWCTSYRPRSVAVGQAYHTTRACASMRSHAHVCAQDEGFRGLPCDGEHRRWGSTPSRFSTVPTTPATQHNKHDRCMVAFQSMCMCACHAHAWDNCRSDLIRIYSERDFFFLFFFPKRIRKTRNWGTKSPRRWNGWG